MSSCHLRAVGYHDDEFYIRFNDYCWNINCGKPGSSVEFLLNILKIVNCTVEVLQVDASLVDTIEMVIIFFFFEIKILFSIQNGSADISLEDIRITNARLENVDFTYPTNYLHFGYIIKEVPEIQVEDYVVNSFDWSVIFILVAFGLVVGSLTSLYNRIIYRDKNIPWLHNLYISCMSLLRQYQYVNHGPASVLILLGVWIFGCMITIAFYEAKLKSFLTLSHVRGTIFTTLNGMLDAVEDKEWIIVIQDKGYDPLEYANEQQLKRFHNLPSHKILRVGPEDDYDAYIKENHVGFVALTSDVDKYQIVQYDNKRKLLFVRDESLAPQFLAYALQKNSSLIEKLNRVLASASIGYQNIRGRYFSPYVEYSQTYKPTQNLTLAHFSALFKVLIEIQIVGIVLLCIENIWFHFGKRFIEYVQGQFRFHYTLRINDKNPTFFRKQMIVLPIRRSFSPIPTEYSRFHMLSDE